jgi:hypothetical protein
LESSFFITPIKYKEIASFLAMTYRRNFSFMTATTCKEIASFLAMTEHAPEPSLRENPDKNAPFLERSSRGFRGNLPGDWNLHSS